MKKILLSLAATAALAAAAAPAAAQSWNDYGRRDGGQRYGQRYDRGGLDMAYLGRLDWQVRQAAQERRISWGEARALLNQLEQVKPAAWRVHTGEARNWERQRVFQTLDRVEQATRRHGYADRGDYRRDWRR